MDLQKILVLAGICYGIGVLITLFIFLLVIAAHIWKTRQAAKRDAKIEALKKKFQQESEQ